MCGDRQQCRTLTYLLHLSGAGLGQKMVPMSRTGLHSQKQLKLAMSFYHANVKRVVQSAENAKRLDFTVQRCEGECSQK